MIEFLTIDDNRVPVFDQLTGDKNPYLGELIENLASKNKFATIGVDGFDVPLYNVFTGERNPFFQRYYNMRNTSLRGYIDKLKKLMGDSDHFVRNATGNNLMRNFFNTLSTLTRPISQEDVGQARYSMIVEAVQAGLVFLGYKLSKFGVDGKFGTETGSAIRKFRDDNNLETQGDDEVIDREFMSVLIKKLRDFKISADDIVKIMGTDDVNVEQNVDENWYEDYVKICQEFINQRQPNPLDITGEMMAQCANVAYQKYKILVPAKLALAQMVLEGGIGNGNRSSRPIKTRNPFNVGNVDSGGNSYYRSVSDAICDYYDLIARSYLGRSNGKFVDVNELLGNFVNKRGNRYASDPNYENKLKSIIKSIS